MAVDTKVSDGRAVVTAPKVFHYNKPDVSDRKIGVHLAQTERGGFVVQVLNHGGENNLHSHKENDGFWFVLNGRVRFYTTDDVLVAELGKNEGIVTPRGYRYWFEAVQGDEDLEIIRFGASTPNKAEKGDRVNYEAVKPNQVGMLEHERAFAGN